MAFVKVASAKDLADGEAKVVQVNGKTIALFRQDGKFFALDNSCLHHGGPLGEGQVEGNIVTCPWHAWQYDITTGENQFNRSMRVSRYRVKVEAGEVHVDV